MNLERLRETLNYNPETGVFTWKKRPLSDFKNLTSMCTWNARYAGKVAGYLQPAKGWPYWGIKLAGKNLTAHRVAWFMYYGEMPDVIDHIDGNGLNNRIANLRNTNSQGNQRNMRQRSGRQLPMGVFASGQRFYAQIQVDKKRISLGGYDDLQSAIKARQSAMEKYGFLPSHGLPAPAIRAMKGDLK